MWFLIATLIILWLIGFISFGPAAYSVHILLITAFVLLILSLLHRRHGPMV